MNTCEVCGEEPAIQHRICLGCASDIGFPNVRAANQAREVSALDGRLASALTLAQASGIGAEVATLRTMLDGSKVVFNRYLSPLLTWLTSDIPLYVNFHDQVAAGRKPQDNGWDYSRVSFENIVSPFYYDKLNVGALSAFGRGMDYYGPYTVTLKDNYVLHRMTCFHQNPHQFCQDMGISPNAVAPPGFRSTWDRRQDLGVAKLVLKLKPGMDVPAMEELLMEPRGSSADCDFIEVHIYGPIHRSSIHKVSGPRPADPTEAPLWDHLKLRLDQLGIELEETA